MIMGLADILSVKVKQRNHNQGMTYIFISSYALNLRPFS